MIPASKDDKYIYCECGTAIGNVDEPNTRFAIYCEGCHGKAQKDWNDFIANLPNKDDESIKNPMEKIEKLVEPNIELPQAKEIESNSPLAIKTCNGELVSITPFNSISIKRLLTPREGGHTHTVWLEKSERDYVVFRGAYDECKETMSKIQKFLVNDELDFFKE